MNLLFFFNSALLGVGLAMDAFSVSLANGLNEPDMRRKKMCGVAGVFAIFQAMMPMIGWICVHTVVQYFTSFEKCIPWIALILLVFIGGKMLLEGLETSPLLAVFSRYFGKNVEKDTEETTEKKQNTVGLGVLMIQGIATSIDALSVGFAIAEYEWFMALLCAFIIAVVTFFICVAGVLIGKKFGTKFSGTATIFGGIILILIGIEIFITGIV